MLRPSLPRLAAARVTSNIRSRVGHDVWGEVHITGLTEPSLATAKASRPSLLRHEPSDYIDLLGGFAAVSTRSGADWPRLLKARPERELLNDLACYTSELAHTLGREGVPFRGPVSLAMFSGASFLGCEASTISLVRLLTGSSGASSASTAGAGGDMSDRPLFRPAVARFRDLVRAGRNPYALATEGLRLMAQGKPHAAARHVERALQLGGGDEAFPWAGQCRVVLGQARQAAGDDAGALEHFTRAAELGQRDAWQWIGRVTAGEGAREDAWFKGGVAGDPVAFGLLADEYAARSVGEDGEQARDLLAWSDEFRMMSGR